MRTFGGQQRPEKAAVDREVAEVAGSSKVTAVPNESPGQAKIGRFLTELAHQTDADNKEGR